MTSTMAAQLLSFLIDFQSTRNKVQELKPPVIAKPASPQAKPLNSTHLAVQKPEPPAPSSSCQLRLMGCNGQNALLSARSDSTVQELKEKIFLQTGIPAKSQILYINNQTLQDGKVLRDFNLRGLTDLLVVHKVRGG
ncbi:ubiquitin D-like [Rhincodon typus]|uniref:ubiquitin D-like n=1 Tax=Rhincodon typus TaxID=259920 RepID=UPI0020306933|nr:ubiquitin D-like [Rhincodon typus]